MKKLFSGRFLLLIGICFASHLALAIDKNGIPNEDLIGINNIKSLLANKEIRDSQCNEKHIIIVIPSYNNERWCIKNIESAVNQRYDNFHVIYINDVSTDSTGQQIEDYIKSHGLENLVTYVNNSVRVGALANFYRSIHACSKDDIIVFLDGDDFLYDDTVLEHLNEVYKNPNVWITWGHYRQWPVGDNGGDGDCDAGIKWRSGYRDAPWTFSHLRTCYAGLFQKVLTEDLMYEGKFFQTTWDLGFMYPTLEMAGPNCKYISRNMYHYNTSNPISDRIVHLGMQLGIERYIKGLPRYRRVKSPFKASHTIYVWPGQWDQFFGNSVENKEFDQKRQFWCRRGDIEVKEAAGLDELTNAEFILASNISAEELSNLNTTDNRSLILWNLPENADISAYPYYFSKIYEWSDLDQLQKRFEL